MRDLWISMRLSRWNVHFFPSLGSVFHSVFDSTKLNQTELKERKQKKEENKQMWWRTIEYRWKLYQKKSIVLWTSFFLHFFVQTVTFWTEIYENMMESTWRRSKSDRIGSDERFHIENHYGHGMSRMNLTVFNVHISQRTNRPTQPLLSVNHILKHHLSHLKYSKQNKNMKLHVSWRRGKVSFVWKFWDWTKQAKKK